MSIATLTKPQIHCTVKLQGTITSVGTKMEFTSEMWYIKKQKAGKIKNYKNSNFSEELDPRYLKQLNKV
jgi:hypothetical protein